MDESGECPECRWEGQFTISATECGNTGGQSGKVTAPFDILQHEFSYEEKFDYALLETLMDEILAECDFDADDFKWNHSRRIFFEELADECAGARAKCEDPRPMHGGFWWTGEETLPCNPCGEGYADFVDKAVRVEFYTDRRDEEKRTWIQRARLQFVPKGRHYWKIFVPQLFQEEEGEKESPEDFPTVCELVESNPGSKIEISAPDEPGHYIILNCAAPQRLSNLVYDEKAGKYFGCMEKKNLPKFLGGLR